MSPSPARRALAVASALAGSRQVRLLVLALCLLLGGLAVAESADAVREGLRRLAPLPLGGALLAAVVAVLASAMAWRALLADLGSPLPAVAAARVFLLGQLGKYLPGSVWAVVGQMELARDLGVPRRRSATAGALLVGVTVATGLLVAAAALPLLALGLARGYVWLLAVTPVCVAVLHPRVLGPALRFAFRRAGRPQPERLPTWGGMLGAGAWAGLGWLLLGLQVWLIAGPLGLSGLLGLLVAAGAYALAWVAGFVVLVAPAGAGVREAVLVAALGPKIGTGEALLVALVSRLVVTVGDLSAAAAALLVRRTPRDRGIGH